MCVFVADDHMLDCQIYYPLEIKLLLLYYYYNGLSGLFICIKS